ncbi:MAG: TlpA family protein disulfide reductase [Betaproteobacteria bacterium]|nr:TlpA family protein disulfide reductase [Betaproteobacteria bacterium]
MSLPRAADRAQGATDKRTLRSSLRPHGVTLVLLGVIAWLWFRPLAWVEDADRPLPPFAVETFDGARVDFAALRGRVVLVNVWASWCVYCWKEMPAIERFHNDYRERGFSVLALSTDESADDARRFLRDKGYTFPGGMVNASVAAALGDVSRLPTSFIIDTGGRLRHRIVGQVHYGRLQDLVEPLLVAPGRPAAP